ncbi:hypothetical protein PVK06_005654 [Gossypium arboreum]|uniref:Uncharacterized protein n=1 Tax=Gossypium arboreum TaxID=29729 RepID=A0ABR0QV52_GOSAR|nr:hypothetical protein PVK06_005654 [Gossypium arboreum]
MGIRIWILEKAKCLGLHFLVTFKGKHQVGWADQMGCELEEQPFINEEERQTRLPIY